jgi:thiamine pyrophosphokinase
MKMTQMESFFEISDAALLGGGVIHVNDVEDIKKCARSLYCADAGYFHAIKYDLSIAGLIGDLDSVGTLDAPTFPIIQVLDQDTTDLEKSLMVINAPRIICYGFLGGRLDHSLAAFNAIAKSDRTVFLVDEQDACVICPAHLDLKLPKGTRFSIFPLTDVRARSKGLKWNVDGVAMSPVGIVSTSNETTDDRVQCWIDDGIAVVIFPREFLDDVLGQWPNTLAG